MILPNMRVIKFWLPLLSYSILFIQSDSRDLPHIAIVGGGIGGTASAYFLREAFGPAASIDLYEPNVIGGKVCSNTVGDREYEAGAVFLTSSCFNILGLIDTLGLKTKDTGFYILSLYNKNGNVFSGSTWKQVQNARLLWKYGWELPNLHQYARSKVGHFFRRIAELQDQRKSFSTLDQMLEAVSGDLGSLLRQSTSDHLREKGYSKAIVTELVDTWTRILFGQGTEANALMGLLVISELIDMPDTKAVAEGNKRVPEQLLSRSKAHLIRETVTTISSSMNNMTSSRSMYQLHSRRDRENEHISRDYDIVIIATPMDGNAANITFRQFKNMFPFDTTCTFHPYVQTLVRGMPNVTRFGAGMFDESSYPVMVPVDIDVIYGLARVKPIVGTKEPDSRKVNEEYIWAVWSPLPLTEEVLDELFISWDEKKQSNWTTYAPPLMPVEGPIPPFELQEQLYYLNPIEHIAAIQELLVIAARNMAIRAFQQWNGGSDIKRKLESNIHQEF